MGHSDNPSRRAKAAAVWLSFAAALTGQALLAQPTPAESAPASALVTPAPQPGEPSQTAPNPEPATSGPIRPQCPPAAEGVLCIAPLTPVKLVIRTHLGSKISTSGQTFVIELAEPIVVDGKVLVPAGTTGQGEVVHAKKSGGSGASGELVLAARYLDLGERRLRLRSMNFAQAGKDSIGTVNTMNVASVAVPGLSLIGFFVKGKGIDVPEGTLAVAKTAEPFVIESSATTPVPAATVTPAQPVIEERKANET